MDSIRTLLLARTNTVVLDPDRVASAATRPTRDVDLEKFEDELAQLGYVMSLDLAMTLRRLPHQTILELRAWIIATLAKVLGAHRPSVPLFRGFRAATPGDASSLYLRRMLTWVLTRPKQPCPWCGQVKPVGALDPCGHLVCQSCWNDGTYAGCPICHRRVAIGDPFVRAATTMELVTQHDGELRLLHLGFDLLGAARSRFERLVGRSTPLSPEDRAEIEVVIDELGPRTVQWLPARIPVKETMAIALARLWMVAPDRRAMVQATHGHLASATDVLRVAVVLLGGNPGLIEPMRLGSVGRSMRRAVLEALDQLGVRTPVDQVIEDAWRHRGLWKRVGERLHPYEYARRLPVATLMFAAVRQTRLDAATFGDAVREEARGVATVRIADGRAKVTPWASMVEDQLRTGDARGAAERLAQRPRELLRRVDHLVRVAQDRQPDALAQVIGAVELAAARGTPATLLGLASHIAQRTAPWPRRVFFPGGEVLRAWATADRRPALRGDAIGALVALLRAELVSRAAARRNFARAVLDRGLVDLHVPMSERTAPRSRLAWPRGSELALPSPLPGGPATLRLFVHWQEPATARADLDLSLVLFDDAWRHVATCDLERLVVGDRAAVHSGDRTAAPAPIGASELIDLDVERLRGLGVRHAVMVVSSESAVPFDQLIHGFAGLTIAPQGGELFDPRAVVPRFDLHGRSVSTVPLVIDLEAGRLRCLDVHIRDHRDLRRAGGYRAALAHIGRDFADLAASAAHPTLWDLAAIHAVARANIVYVRERTGAIAAYRRRDREQALARLARLTTGEDPDGALDELPPANAPTWFALLRDDIALPAGSTGYVLDARAQGAGLERLSPRDLLGELGR
ncbi:MAG TPA: MXAN_6230/SCO0854 family RING domain-containing protein [Kofleriaceae bacterium]|nr:MXAN_6230/SCO0854 family RING domain-containing protein [Kofleriaceae bacterium]